MPAQLVALTDGPTILLDKPILLLGRHPECDIQLNSRKISRRHCCIAQVSNYLVVRDLGSTNGIRVNGVRVVEGKLKAGDELTVGNFRYQLTWDDKPISAQTARPAIPVRSRPSQSKPGTKPINPKSVAPASAKPPTDMSEDALLESCDEPVPIGKARKPEAPKPADSPPIFPDNVNLRDSKLEI
jgi:predicted component of type VI protein secretion system